MKWHKMGLIITPQKNLWWMHSHAMLPTIDYLHNDFFRVYFSGRDKQNRSYIGYALIKVAKSITVLKYSPEPVLTLGELGCFDDNGVTPSWVINWQDKKYLYYIGWNKGSLVRMSLIAGLAVSADNGKSFSRFSRAPILERTNSEPFSILTAPCVIRDSHIWRMWYVSGICWVHKDLPRYNIKYAESKDGITWKRTGKVCVELGSNENALARPCVLKDNGVYKMWYSYKGENYRIGYAESKDGLCWTRKDNLSGINVSSSGWDSQTIEYALVFEHNNIRYMLYNGNNYGEDGIGLAVQEKNDKGENEE